MIKYQWHNPYNNDEWDEECLISSNEFWESMKNWSDDLYDGRLIGYELYWMECEE